MTVTTSLNYKEYQADGMVNKFAIPFLLLARSDLYVYVNNQLVTSGYTVTGLGNPISEIIFEEAPQGLLLLQRSITLIRETDYQENGDLLAKTVNQDFDRIYLAMQGFAQDTSKALRVTDAEGVSALPLADERANKTLSFDSTGQPILTTTATGSAAELAQRLVDASSENKGSGLIGYNKTLNYPTRTIGNALNTLTNRFDNFEGNGVPLFSVFWWPSRANIPAGYVVADGQELSQAVFPDAAAAIQQAKVPTVQELEWQMDPLKRGSYVANSSQGKFRVPDYNGKYADSLGALFLRGDNGVVGNGMIQQDALQNITGSLSSILFRKDYEKDAEGALYFEASTNGGISANAGGTSSSIKIDASRVVRTAGETRPINVSGCWIIKLFGYVINTAEADLQQIITENANLAARLSVLESYQQAKKFTIIYPNDGTEDNPANIMVNKRYVMDNPFKGYPIICLAELLVNGVWGAAGHVNIAASGTAYGVGCWPYGDDKIVTQTAGGGIIIASANSGNPHGITTSLQTAPCRVKVWRVI
ncbi:hypothetical protein [Entomomonas asaccharolytica]|uniref:Tail fiber protein n=1 Tax=Entomomonas asaccharolytica TaxID=2785331 RepID=A0A974RVZ7_9GAMM|nr:hypothetical protein [Entomomonas asaccharolytica]QQP84696.1 hypothetical protein JHT90_09775 [Entomomonas asaccharolytica]